MKGSFSISLQNRLALTCALFTGLALTALTVIINIFTGLVFTALVKNNIAAKSAEIVRAVADQYNPMSRSFNAAAIEAMGMYFVHEGYIVTVEDGEGNPVWNARACDMRECTEVINSIALRMEGRLGANGAMRRQRYPALYAGGVTGTVVIETWGPFFYSETEAAFLASVNRLLVAATIILTLFAAAVSGMFARAIARPVNRAAEAARLLARAWGKPDADEASDGPPPPPVIRIDDRYYTRELAELARSVNALALELEEGERRQKQLVSDIAHELRTPLTCLQGDIEAMIDGVYRPDKERLESCHEEIMRLANLVKDLNTLTILEWEQISLNKTGFDLAALLRATAEQFRAAAAAKGAVMQLDLVESPIHADYDRLRQVFVNIISNAVKYTGKGSITIRVREGGSLPPGSGPLRGPPPPPSAGAAGGGSVPPQRPQGWEVTVADTGSGIAESDLPHIFERLYRADKSRSRDTGGAGIGLAIARAIVHAHGGTISAESPGSGGSVFRVAL